MSIDKLEEGLVIEVDMNGVWNKAVVMGLVDEEENIGTAVYHIEGANFGYDFAWLGFEHDPRVRFCDE